MAFSRLIRFVAKDGQTYFGNAILSRGNTDCRLVTQAHKINGDIFSEHEVTDEILDVMKILSPLDSTHVRTVRMIGLNYKKHCLEAGFIIPEWPCLFYKPSSAISGPDQNVDVPKEAQIEDAKVDYESELVVVIGKAGRDIPESEALKYVLGYSVGNDMSQRTWQQERGGSQFNVGKMFDTFAPFGPAIVSPSIISDPNDLKIGSKVNGETRQNSETNDMIFSVKKLVSHLSMGTTLQPGDLIYTGTPEGVGMGFKPPVWLRDGDIVECHIENIGSIRNKITYQ